MIFLIKDHYLAQSALFKAVSGAIASEHEPPIPPGRVGWAGSGGPLRLTASAAPQTDAKGAIG
jgi:hypothetical protein